MNFRCWLSKSRLFLCIALCLVTPALVQAEVHIGIEIGAKGIRAIAVNYVKGAEAKILMVENKNTTLVADLAAKKRYSSDALKATAEIVGDLAKKLRSEFKVPNTRVYVVGSSGLFTPIEGDEALIKANKGLLIEAIRAAIGRDMDFVTVVREAELTILSVIPADSRADGVLMDIGSGNTKGGAHQAGAGLITFAIPFGTVTFADRIKKDVDKNDFVATAARLRREIVTPKLNESLQGKAELVKRKLVYLAGGSVWAVTTFAKPADRGSLVPLTPRDIDAFYKLLVDNPMDLPKVDLSMIKDAEVKKAAAKDMDQVRKTFTHDQMVSGVEILKALVDAFELNAPNKLIVFSRNAYIGWILGYTVERGSAPW